MNVYQTGEWIYNFSHGEDAYRHASKNEMKLANRLIFSEKNNNEIIKRQKQFIISLSIKFSTHGQ